MAPLPLNRSLASSLPLTVWMNWPTLTIRLPACSTLLLVQLSAVMVSAPRVSRLPSPSVALAVSMSKAPRPTWSTLPPALRKLPAITPSSWLALSRAPPRLSKSPSRLSWVRPPLPRARSCPLRLSSAAAARVRVLSLSMIPWRLSRVPARLKSTLPAAIWPPLASWVPMTWSSCLAKRPPWRLSSWPVASLASPPRAETCPPWLFRPLAARSRDCAWMTPPWPERELSSQPSRCALTQPCRLARTPPRLSRLVASS
ncbi:hypothetical protein D9M68_532030 [compost metagenome]